MADNLTTTTTVSTIPNNTVVATEDEGGVHYQKVKLTASASGSTEALSKAEDSAHTSGEHGILALGIRSDTLGTAGNIGGATGDYMGAQFDAVGAQWSRDTWKTPQGDSMVDDTNEALRATLVTAPQVIGLKAHDAADDEATNLPVKLGAKATTSVVGLTPVATADMTDLFAGADGVLITRQHCNLEDSISGVLANTDGASTVFTGSFAATASQRIYITGATVANAHASTFCTVDIRDGAAGSVLYTLPAPASSGGTYVFSPPLRLTANTAAAMDASAAVTTVTLSLTGFKSKV